MKIKKFTNKKPELPKTEMKDKIINLAQVEKMKITVYDPKANGHQTLEVDFHFDSPQAEWNGHEVLKLRNELYKINNIAYKMPTGFEEFTPFYELAVQRAREFKTYTGSDLHNKLGKKYPDRYYTIPFTYASYDPVTKTGILQITMPFINTDDQIDVLTHYQCIDFELEVRGKGVNYTWIS